MIRVYIWNYRGLTVAMGHASMAVGADYISWWPEGAGRRSKIPGPVGGKLPLYAVRHIQGQSFQDDKDYEGTPGKPMPPDHSMPLEGLDETRLLVWWRKYNVPHRDWTTLGQNCATTVGRGLMIAGGDDYCDGAAGWWNSWNLVWQPNDVLPYARDIERGLISKRGQHAAINFVRRFLKSPLGLTSVTASVDERGLAAAIYHEVRARTELIRGIFEQLDSRRNTDADDIAEIYVDLLRTKRGPPSKAVAADARLKQLLIRILSEGFTSAGERRCIDFLKAL